ncbi:MAG: L-threonylcarbamoyladenylate synthase [Candidatus Peregrinibacteria bacterium]
MKIVDINDKGALDEAVRVLRDGGLVMHPTETCYGFAVDIFNPEALGKVYAIKGRKKRKPLGILVASYAMAEKYGVFSEKAKELVLKYWPGALSIVVPRREELPAFFNEGEECVSMRVSSHEFSTNMVREFGGPISTTSANVSSEPPLYMADLSQFGELGDSIDLVADGGKLPEHLPSTLIKVVGERVEVLRKGEILCE